MVNVWRGQIWWAEMGMPIGSGPVHRRPVLVIQANFANQSHLPTVICAVLILNLEREHDPHNFVLSKAETGLPADSVVNVSQIVTLDKRVQLLEYVGQIGAIALMQLGFATANMIGLRGDLRPPV